MKPSKIPKGQVGEAFKSSAESANKGGGGGLLGKLTGGAGDAGAGGQPGVDPKEQKKTKSKADKLLKTMRQRKKQEQEEKAKQQQQGKGGKSVKSPNPPANPYKNIKKPMEEQKNKNDLNTVEVNETLGKISDNVTKILKDKKVKNSFMLNYTKVQGGIMKQMALVDKAEADANKDCDSAHKGIASLKKSGGSSNIFSMILSGIGSIFFFALGAIILITLVRMALNKWCNTYMPKTDGSTMTIFGFQIPGWAEIKAFVLGIKNFILIGLPNWWDRLKCFFGNVKRALFGKKGVFRNGARAKEAIEKIIHALIISVVKKVYGVFFNILGTILSVCCGPWGPLVKLICELIPALITFIWTQIMLLWKGHQASEEEKYQADMRGQLLTGKKALKGLHTELLKMSTKVNTFKGQELNIPGLEVAKGPGGKNAPDRKAIMRVVPVGKLRKNFLKGKELQKETWEKGADERKEKYEQKVAEAAKAKSNSISAKLI